MYRCMHMDGGPVRTLATLLYHRPSYSLKMESLTELEACTLARLGWLAIEVLRSACF